MRAALVIACLLGVLGVSNGCGSSTSTSTAADPGSSSPTSTTPTSEPSTTHHTSKGPSEPSWADCSIVWRAGERLPGSYPGCNQGNASIAADRLGCSSGQRLVRFDNHWWAAAGGVIHHSNDLMHDKTYIHSAQVCRG
jgi:hypothetical protein